MTFEIEYERKNFWGIPRNYSDEVYGLSKDAFIKAFRYLKNHYDSVIKISDSATNRCLSIFFEDIDEFEMGIFKLREWNTFHSYEDFKFKYDKAKEYAIEFMKTKCNYTLGE